MRRYIKRRDKILMDAIVLMDQKGLHGLTTRELASIQGITEPAVYRQFSGKKDLVSAILGEFSKHDRAIAETVEKSDRTPEEKIAYFLQLYGECYEAYPEIASAYLAMEYIRADEEIFKQYMRIMEGRKKTIETFVGGMEGINKKKKDALVESINGIIFYQVIFWKLNGEKYSLRERIGEALSLLLN